ncbi:phosphopentomutase [Mollicutes bacterium LVI A0039]|nr:phosphopentomutase [Mollicutes bacterium LVI A0039]
MKKFKRATIIVLDSAGIGELPDAKRFGDENVNTIGHISSTVGLNVPNMEAMGLGNIADLATVKPTANPIAKFGKMAEVGEGKDTLTGHWEMMGNTLHQGFNQFTDNGFPEEVIAEFEARTGRKVIANIEGSGMKVIAQYFDEHMETGSFIVYTSADSTFQIAAHEDVVSIEELYKACEIASEIVQTPKYNVARIIARPFIGGRNDFTRTANRHDYAQSPTEYLVTEKLQDAGLDCISIGKINDIFTGKGITEAFKSKSNDDGVKLTIEQLKRDDINGLIFTNLVDFDTLGGHPRDAALYRDMLETFDSQLPEIMAAMNEDDLLVITADHGNDPTYLGNDHTREYVPILCYSPSIGGGEIPTRNTFEDLGETLCENWSLKSTNEGTSFLAELIK